MSFNDIKEAVASYDAVVVDSGAEGEVSANEAASNFSGEVFVWRSKDLKFTHRSNPNVLKVVDSAAEWKVVGDVLIACSKPNVLESILAPAPPPPEPEPAPQKEVEPKQFSPSDRFKFWEGE